jgi:hypothetical protein
MNLSPFTIVGLDVTISEPKSSPSELRHYLQRGDARASKVDGAILGRMCAEFGLEPGTSISDHAFDSLASNRHPQTGDELVAERKQEERNAFVYTFLGPKITRELPAQGYSSLLVAMHERAVGRTLEQLEYQTHIRYDLAIQLTGRFVAAAFLHANCEPFEDKILTEVVVFDFSRNDTSRPYSPLILVSPNNDLERLKESYSISSVPLAADLDPLRHTLLLDFDGKVVICEKVDCYPALPRSILLLHNFVGFSTAARDFSGRLLSAHRVLPGEIMSEMRGFSPN